MASFKEKEKTGALRYSDIAFECRLVHGYEKHLAAGVSRPAAIAIFSSVELR